MTVRIILAIVHLLALGIGLGAVWGRASALRGSVDASSLTRAFAADTWWGVSALLWIGTGLARAFAGYEKGSAYYLANHFFWLKMALLIAILALEVAPMIGLIRWRIRHRRGQSIDLAPAARYARISQVQAGLIVLMVGAAALMARGFGMHG